jgi:hypothetical protein
MIPKHIFKSAKFPDFRVGFQDRRSVTRYIRYIQRESGIGELVKNSFEFDDALAIANQCSMMRSKSKYWGYAFCVSFPAEETAKWEPHLKEIADDMDRLQGAEWSLWGTHRDKKFLHIHGFLFNSRKNGKPLDLVKGGRLRPFAQKWEDRLDARKTGRVPAGPQVSRDLLLMEERTGVTPATVQLQADVGLLVQRSQSWEGLQQNAAAMGVTVQFKEKDGRIVGVSFGNGITQLGGKKCGYSLSQLETLYGTKQSTTIIGAGRDSPSPHRTEQAPGPAHPKSPGVRQADSGAFGLVKKAARILTRCSPMALLLCFMADFVSNAYTRGQEQAIGEDIE